MFLLRSGLRFSFRALEVPEPFSMMGIFSIGQVFRTHVNHYGEKDSDCDSDGNMH